jgi:hypothetical protein
MVLPQLTSYYVQEPTRRVTVERHDTPRCFHLSNKAIAGWLKIQMISVGVSR